MSLAALLFDPEFQSWGTVRLGLGYPGMLQASAAITALHPVELELGVEGSLGHAGFTARGGPALRLFDTRGASGRGVSAHVPLMVGYRYWDFAREYPAHSLSLTVQPTLDLWLLKHLAIDMQLVLGANVVLRDPSSGLASPVVPEVALRGGFAF